MASTRQQGGTESPDGTTPSPMRAVAPTSRRAPVPACIRVSLLALGCALAMLPTLRAARAQTFTANYTGAGKADTATAVFSLINGTTLQVALTNTSTYSSGWSNGDLLSGLFFDIASAPNLTPVSADASGMVGTSGCRSIACDGAAPVDVGYEWAYVNRSSGFSGPITTTARYGLAAAGFSKETNAGFGSKSNIFNSDSPNYTGTRGGVGGLNFSIAGANYDAAQSATSLLGVPLAQDTVTFQFSLPSPVASLQISNVTFAYGTNPDGSFGGTLITGGGTSRAPEPASIALFASGLAAMGLIRRHRRHRA